jgi:RNA polymerase sigma factor (sigma-70 family)
MVPPPPTPPSPAASGQATSSAPRVRSYVTADRPLTRAEEAALVADFGRGDPAAAADLLRRYQGRVFGLALAVTRHRVTAEDVAQEAFVRAWRAAPVYDPRRGSLATWLLTITRNAAIDSLRSSRDAATSPQLLEEAVGHSLHDDHTDATADRLDAQRALRTLATSHPEQARAVMLAVLAGCTAREVSQHEDIPLGTAKTRIRTGLARIRTATFISPIPCGPSDV